MLMTKMTSGRSRGSLVGGDNFAERLEGCVASSIGA